MEPRRGFGPGLRHRLYHADVVEIEYVSRDHSVDDDDGRNLSTAFAGNGAVREWYGNLRACFCFALLQ